EEIAIFLANYFFLISLILLIQTAVRLFPIELTLTNQRIIWKSGFGRNNNFPILLEQIESLAVKQNRLDLLFNVGSIIVTECGGNMVVIPNIVSPAAFYAQAEATRAESVRLRTAVSFA
ncbi:MAG: PH domain-containing protein, partial [Gammaproteobacteria bacterium]